METVKMETVSINGVKYVREDSVVLCQNATSTDGLKAVLVRSYAAGVHFGYLLKEEFTPAGKVVILVNTRRVYTWYGACSLSQLALEGVKEPDKCQFSVEIPTNEIVNVIETIPLSLSSLANLNSVKPWKK
jgi:hypothetical protein